MFGGSVFFCTFALTQTNKRVIDMKKSNLFLTVLFALLVLASCSDDNGYTVTTRPVPDLIKIELNETEKQQVQTNNEFAFNLSRKVYNENKNDNFLISPLSATYVLAMLENGSNGETQQQILSALRFDKEESMNAVCGKLIAGASKVDASTEVDVANGLFLDKSVPFKADYMKTMASTYGAEVKNLDFSDQQTALKAINSWSNEKTKGKIPTIIKNLSNNTKIAALNAIYFKGKWNIEFDSNNTSKETFTHADGIKTQVDMMKVKDNFLFGAFSKFDMLHMAYGNNGYSMEVLLPREGVSIADVLNSIKSADWQKTMMAMDDYEADVQLPKFTIDYSVDMQPVLKALGMTDMFDTSKADFSRLSDVKTVVGLFTQKCTIDVNEKGTEATTTTIATNGDMANVVPTTEFHANRPFIYLITENTTGAIYFIGIYR